MNDRVVRYLKNEPRFRERKNKNRGLVNLLMDMHPSLRQAVQSGVMQKDTIVAIVQEYSTMDRHWRQTLELNADLRGSDYNDKKLLEQEKQVELRYQPGYHEANKQLAEKVEEEEPYIPHYAR